jgi:endoglucanase
MKYPFWVFDWNRVKDYQDKYPLTKEIFKHPLSLWYGNRSAKPIKGLQKSLIRLFKRSGNKMPILVVYNMPNRDIGQYSKGGANTHDEYLEFVQDFANGIGKNKPIVIFEPDAVPHLTHLDDNEANSRIVLMKEALNILATTSAYIYVDVGHSNWLSPKEVDEYLNKVTNPKVKGFSVNVSNYRTTKESIEWANKICELRSNDCYVVDTSRNGNGPHGNEWCNPPGRALGEPPTCITGEDRCDAFLWIKIPGESDGKGNGGPRAGRMWGEQAEELVRNTSWIKTFS